MKPEAAIASDLELLEGMIATATERLNALLAMIRSKADPSRSPEALKKEVLCKISEITSDLDDAEYDLHDLELDRQVRIAHGKGPAGYKLPAGRPSGIRHD